jgi:hypothetical protein
MRQRQRILEPTVSRPNDHRPSHPGAHALPVTTGDRRCRRRRSDRRGTGHATDCSRAWRALLCGQNGNGPSPAAVRRRAARRNPRELWRAEQCWRSLDAFGANSFATVLAQPAGTTGLRVRSAGGGGTDPTKVCKGVDVCPDGRSAMKRYADLRNVTAAVR